MGAMIMPAGRCAITMPLAPGGLQPACSTIESMRHFTPGHANRGATSIGWTDVPAHDDRVASGPGIIGPPAASGRTRRSRCFRGLNGACRLSRSKIPSRRRGFLLVRLGVHERRAQLDPADRADVGRAGRVRSRAVRDDGPRGRLARVLDAGRFRRPALRHARRVRGDPRRQCAADRTAYDGQAPAFAINFPMRLRCFTG